MKHLALLLFINLFSTLTISKNELDNDTKIKIEVKHHFPEIYKKIRAHEGCYVYHESDRGGETYGGIPRNFHKKWYGWRHVDKARPHYRHQKIEAAEFWVMDFYLTIWVREGFENIKDKELALNLFDFRIHSSPKTVEKKINRVLEKINQKPIKFGQNWIDNRFNNVDPKEFILLLKIERIVLFNYLVNKDDTQRVFYNGWINRLRNI